MFNYNKLKSSAIIMLLGILLVTVPTMSNNLIDIIRNGAEFDWITPTTFAIGAFSTWIVATIRNYINNK